MSYMQLSPDASLGTMIFSHRHNWDGTICKGASLWNCGSPQEFRDQYCTEGRDRCNVIHTFDRTGPRLKVVHDSLSWLLAEDPDILIDRILLIWSKATRGEYGIPPAAPAFRVAGAYRIARVEKLGFGPRPWWEIHPHRGQWCRFHELNLATPAFRETPNSLIKIVEAESLRSLFRKVEEQIGENPELITQDVDRENVTAFVRQLPEWLKEQAAKPKSDGLRSNPFSSLVSTGLPLSAPPPKPPLIPAWPVKSEPKPDTASGGPANSEVGLGGPARPSSPVRGSNSESTATVTQKEGLLENSKLHRDIERTYGRSVLTALLSAAASKKIIVLRGLPGMGKSHLAQRLLDPQRPERIFTLPVSATWRGSEDLLGYVNPVDRKFQATAFTQFLIEAANAWDAGDRAHRLVIFEEFNLSQPEYWLTDILVRSEFPAENRLARTLPLSSSTDPKERLSVFLSPAIRFVATLNNDHTTRSLSPRVLDRAAVIELGITPEVALECRSISISPEQLESIRQLNFILRLKGVCFSHRTAESLSACVERFGRDVSIWPYLDSVLAMEVMSRVRLLTANPADEKVLADLEKWADEQSANLPESARMIRSWRELVDSGQDIAQA